jgi:hypothetical protein
MHKVILRIILFCILASFVIGGLLYAAVPASEQAALWMDLQEAKNKPSASKLDAWNVIEGIRLIRKSDGVSKGAAALATVIKHDKGDKLIYGDDQVSAVLANKAMKKDLNERDLAKLRERFDEHNAMISEEYEEAKKGRSKFLTRGTDFSRLIEKYLSENRRDLVKATKAFAAKRAYAAEIVKKEGPAFSYVVDSIAKKEPLVLQQAGTDNFIVCIGFLAKGGTPYVITADPGVIDFEEVSNADFILGGGEMARLAREQAKELDKQYGLAKEDRTFHVSGELPRGVEINKWGQGNFVSYSIDFFVTEQSVDKTFSSGMGGMLK